MSVPSFEFDTLAELQEVWNKPQNSAIETPDELVLCDFVGCEQAANYLVPHTLFFVEFSMNLLGLYFKGPIHVVEITALCRYHLRNENR